MDWIAMHHVHPILLGQKMSSNRMGLSARLTKSQRDLQLSPMLRAQPLHTWRSSVA